jgi:hypothetical protein
VIDTIDKTKHRQLYLLLILALLVLVLFIMTQRFRANVQAESALNPVDVWEDARV